MRRGASPRLVAVSVALALLLPLALLATAPAASAAPAGCAGRLAQGPWVRTTASFSQRVYLIPCAESHVLSAGIDFAPAAGFSNRNVVGCTVHIGVVRDSYPYEHADYTKSCTAAAQLNGRWSMDLDRTFIRYAYGRYHLTAWINIQTRCCYYGTYSHASRVNFTGYAGP